MLDIHKSSAIIKSMKKNSKRTGEYRGYQITTYEGPFGNYRISKIERPDGSRVDGKEWNFQHYSEKYHRLVNSNIGLVRKNCLRFVKTRIDCEVDGTELPSAKRARLIAEMKEIGRKEFKAKYGLIDFVNC